MMASPSEDWRETAHDVVTGVWLGSLRAFIIMATWCYVNLIRPTASALGVIHLPEGKRQHVPDGRIRVAAVGFGRTGTVCYLYWYRSRLNRIRRQRSSPLLGLSHVLFAYSRLPLHS